MVPLGKCCSKQKNLCGVSIIFTQPNSSGCYFHYLNFTAKNYALRIIVYINFITFVQRTKKELIWCVSAMKNAPCHVCMHVCVNFLKQIRNNLSLSVAKVSSKQTWVPWTIFIAVCNWQCDCYYHLENQFTNCSFHIPTPLSQS